MKNKRMNEHHYSTMSSRYSKKNCHTTPI